MKYVRFCGGTGYCGCDYEEYAEFEDDVPEAEIDRISVEIAYENAEAYEYVVTGWDSDFEDDEDRISYYEDALGYTDWDYCSKEEYEENGK